MAESLGATTTAEGVETEQELAAVRALGCSQVQGYLFWAPLANAHALRLFGGRPGSTAGQAVA